MLKHMNRGVEKVNVVNYLLALQNWWISIVMNIMPMY